jgi:DNA-binding IclR family transcriptional regulator
MLSGLQGVVLDVCEGPRVVRVPQTPGALIPLHCSASGKVLLAYALKSRLPQIAAQGLAARTPNSLTTLAELEAETDRILTLGYAVDDEEYYEGVRCLAAPVWDASGGTRAALGIVASASTFNRRQNQEVAQHVLWATRELAVALGHEGPRPID